jgi:hypothetical protein
VPRVGNLVLKEIWDLPAIDMIDWEFWKELEAVLLRHVPPNHGQRLFRVKTHSGDFEARNVLELSSEVEFRDEVPFLIAAVIDTDYQGGYSISVCVFDTSNQVRLRGGPGSDTFVRTLAEEITAVFERAAARSAADTRGEARRRLPPAAAVRGYLRDVSAQAIAGVLAVGVVAGAAAVWAIFFR